MTRRRAKVFRTGAIGVGLLAVFAIVAGISYPRWRAPRSSVASLPPAAAPVFVPPADRASQPAPSSASRPAQPLRRRVPDGTNLGKIEIPRLHVATLLIEGTDERELKRGAGHVPSTAMPGPSGNVAIAAHRDKFFRALRFIKPDDEIAVTTRDGTFRYHVKATQIVSPQDVSVLRQTEDPQLTLITCYPFYYVGHAPKRFIVHADREPDLTASR